VLNSTVLYLNLDNFCRIFPKIEPCELADELLHDQTAFVLNEVLLDPLFLVPAEFVRQS
jgi:hypothetical protein